MVVVKDRITSLSKQTVFIVFLVSEACKTFLNALKWMRVFDMALTECSRKKLFCKDVSEIKIKPKKQLPPNF